MRALTIARSVPALHAPAPPNSPSANVVAYQPVMKRIVFLLSSKDAAARPLDALARAGSVQAAPALCPLRTHATLDHQVRKWLLCRARCGYGERMETIGGLDPEALN